MRSDRLEALSRHEGQPLLSSTFLHVPGIGAKTEQLLWSRGVTDWPRYLEGAEPQLAIPGLRTRGTPSKEREARIVERSMAALDNGDYEYFAAMLPRSEHWRLYGAFRDQFAFLDVETTGLSRVYDKLTLAGIFDDAGYAAYIDGHNLEDLPEALARTPLLVTFNGLLFDWPFIRTNFPQVKAPAVHIDLRFLLRRIGLAGSLKSIEREVGIQRSGDVADLTGFDATVLWSRYARGDTVALAELIKYNVQDTVNLKVLMDMAFEVLSEAICPMQDANDEILLPADGPRVVTVSDGLLVGENHIVLHDAPPRRFPVQMDNLLQGASVEGAPPRIVGIDLTGSEQRPTGWALLAGDQVETARVKTDDDLVRLTMEARPDVVSIDSPLALPKGRVSIEGDSSGAGISRECERYLKRIGVSVFWCLLPSMCGLTARGIALADRFRRAGVEVIESFPGAAQDILQIPRKKASREELMEGLSSFGIHGTYEHVPVSHDELDAITSALVGLFYLAGQYEGLGNPEEGYLIVPAISATTVAPR